MLLKGRLVVPFSLNPHADKAATKNSNAAAFSSFEKDLKQLYFINLTYHVN